MTKLDEVLNTYYKKRQFASSKDDTDYTAKTVEQVKALMLGLVNRAVPPTPTELDSKELIDYYDGVQYAKEKIRKEVEGL